MSDKTRMMIGINPDILQPKDPQHQPIFKGNGYEVVGPLVHPADGMGLLKAASHELIREMQEKRKELGRMLGDVELMSFVSNVSAEPPMALVAMPSAGFIRMEVAIERGRVDAALFANVLRREKAKHHYSKDLSPSDFWIDPVTQKLFLFGLDKLK